MRKLVMLGVLMCVLAGTLSAPVGAAELRGLWVDAWHPGFKSPVETSAMVSKARECKFNALFVQARKRGDVYYNSSIEPMAKDVPLGYDPLADVVAKAHAAGLQVHAWISVYEVYHDTKWTSSDPRQVHIRHPEWLMKDDRGRNNFPGDKVFLDPGLPEVQAYLTGIVEEIVRNYNVDGIHLDIARYPGREGGYNDASIARFNKETAGTGKPDKDDEGWCDWRRAQVTQFVQTAYEKATRIRRQVKVSAAVSANRSNAYWHRFQDWEGWLRAGILDFAVPMVFAKDTRVFQAGCTEIAALATGRPIYIGQGGFKMSAENSLKQISIAREAGFAGIVVYSYACCSEPHEDDASSLMDELKSGHFAQPDTVPAISRK